MRPIQEVQQDAHWQLVGAVPDAAGSGALEFDAATLAAAAHLNDQLRTLKLLDLRVGEVVKEALQLQERAAGSDVALNARPVDRSPTHPGAQPLDGMGA